MIFYFAFLYSSSRDDKNLINAVKQDENSYKEINDKLKIKIFYSVKSLKFYKVRFQSHQGLEPYFLDTIELQR